MSAERRLPRASRGVPNVLRVTLRRLFPVPKYFRSGYKSPHVAANWLALRHVHEPPCRYATIPEPFSVRTAFHQLKMDMLFDLNGCRNYSDQT